MMEWKVFYHDMNQRIITTYNVFDHYSFRTEVLLWLKKSRTKEEFGEKLRSTLLYYFWAKAEWEVLITPFGGTAKTIKVDVFTQVMNNWEIFLDYVWSNRKSR